MKRTAAILALGAGALAPDLAAAYIGPGAGLSAIGSVLGFLGVVVLLVAGFLWYPVKRFLRMIRARRAGPETMAASDDAEP